MSRIDRLTLSLLLSYKSESGDDCGIFQGFGTAVEVKNEPTAMLTLIDTLAAALIPVVKKDGEESDVLQNVAKEVSKCECIYQTSEWRVDFKKPTGKLKISQSPRSKSFNSSLDSLQKMFSGRSCVHEGLGLATDSQSIQEVARATKTLMENQQKSLKKKRLDSFDLVDVKRFCKTDGSPHGFSVVGTFTRTGIPLQANSTSLLIFHNEEYRWIASSNMTHTSKTDFAQYATARLKGDGSKGKQKVLQIFGVKARTGESHGFYSLAEGLRIGDDKKIAAKDGWNNHLSSVTKNRVKPLGEKVIKRTTLGCDDASSVLGSGHITLVDGKAEYHIPLSTMEEWKQINASSCHAPDAVEKKGKKRPAPTPVDDGKGKKRVASSSATPTGSASSSSMESTTSPNPSDKRKADDEEEALEEPEPKRPNDGNCSCSGCKSSRYVIFYF